MRVLILVLAMVGSLSADEWISLWSTPAPGASQLPAGTEVVNSRRQILETEVPQYALYKPENPNGQVVVVFPGGGYGMVSMGNEGYPVASWLNQRGVTALVVKYRVSQKPETGYQFPVPLLDARRAIRTVRANAEKWGVDPARVGVMGFSAGGHLASMCATMFGEHLEQESGDELDSVSCRPDFAILVYPVIAMGQPYVHKGSQQRLLGDQPSLEAVRRCNIALSVSTETPPCFVVHAADDQAVPLQNALDFISACAREKVPVVSYIYSQGGHGFGMKGRGDSLSWPERLGEWLQRQ